MSTAIWGEPESRPDQDVPASLLKHLLRQMMVQFACTGACIALYDEQFDHMKIQLHVRLRNGNSATTVAPRNATNTEGNILDHHITDSLPDPSASAPGRAKRITRALTSEEVEVVTPRQCDFFPIGATYRLGQDLIGYVWHKNETHIMRHEDYFAFFYTGPQEDLKIDVMPTWYLVVPMQEPTLLDEVYGRKKQPGMMGIVILYQTTTGAVFLQKQRSEAREFAERIALYLQNDQLRSQQRRSSDYLKQLQSISTAFPTSVQLAKLVENVYEFTSSIVDVLSMLISLYDRDTEKIYDVFAIREGNRVEGLTEKPEIIEPGEHPVWWSATQEKKEKLLLDLTHYESGEYDELLTGTWGDQRKAGSFLLLPMKMFNRVIGSLCITSLHPNAYHEEEIQVLETMVQIVTVSIENAKLYERSREALRGAKQREELLAAMNSALQTISVSTVLDVNDIQHKFVESAAKLAQTEMSIFFQCSADKEQLIVQTAYETQKQRFQGNEDVDYAVNQEHHDKLFEKIRLPFKGSPLEKLVGLGFFYLDQSMAEELASACDEGGTIFLLETGIQKMLMIPVLYQAELIGILGVHTPKQVRNFRPSEIGMLLALSAQAASAIRNAQLFEEIQLAYAEQQQLGRLKDEFLVTASHELRTPLSAISGYSTLLKRQSGRINPQQITRYATKITGAAQQLTDLVNSMTEAAKLGVVDKKLDLQIGPVQLHAAVEMAVNLLSVNVEQKLVTQVGTDLWVEGDPLRVRQVISNLLDNAAKYSEGDSRIEVIANATVLAQVGLPEDQFDIETDPNLSVVLVQVYDEGEGIDPEDQQKIFEKFVRATRSLTTPVRGSGLGLFICRRYIEAMGGRLWLQQSVPGEGSVFAFYLPRMEAPVEVEAGKGEQDEPEPQQTS